MTPYFRPACLAVMLVATAAPASAQTWFYEPDAGVRVYEPGIYAPRIYEPRAYYGAYGDYGYEPGVAVATQPLALTPRQRTTIYRTIIPQGRGRAPIVRERIVTETVAPTPAVRERVVTRPVVADYAVGSRVADAYALAPLPSTVVASVPATRPYRYMVINNRLLLVDPATGIVVADITQ
jgi:hypothetical protein